jgi:N-acetyl-anhydromuramyl-L-alanine amidase AmpD
MRTPIKNIIILIACVMFYITTVEAKSNFPVKRIVIHVTDTNDMYDIGADEINVLHKYFFDWNGGCGYHYVIRRDGTVERCRPDKKQGAHVRDFNTGSIGVVWVGRFVISTSQYRQLLSVTRMLMEKYKLTKDDVYPHKHFPSAKEQGKTCPNIDMKQFKEDL